METKRINWIKIVIEVLAVFVFILLLAWILPFGNKDKSKATNFGNNFDTYRESIKKYYSKSSNLPELSETLTLQQLIDKKVVKKLYDQSGNLCDVNKSNVSVIKVDENNYQLDIELTCGKESDRVLDTIVVKKNTNSNSNTTQNTDNTNTNTNANVNNSNNNSNNSGNKVNETTLTQYRYTKDTIEKEISYKCPEGYTLNGKVCVKTTFASIKATPIYSEARIDRIDALKVIGNEIVVYSEPIVENGNKQINCPVGTKVGADNKCHSTGTSTIAAEAKVERYCDGSDTLNGTKCTKSSSYRTDAEKVTGYTNWSCSQIKTNSPMSSSNTNLIKYQQIDQGIENACSNTPGCYKPVVYYKYTKCTRQETVSYKCPNGTRQDGSSCWVTNTSTYDAHTKTTYSCPNGTLNGTNCIINKDNISEPEVTYTKVYNCKDGYTLDEKNGVKVCYKYEKTEDKYYCSDDSYTLDTKTNKCVKKIDKQLTGYTCPTGYTLKDGTCYKNEETISAKKWTKCIITHLFTWNSNSNLDGWVKTGETRTITVK